MSSALEIVARVGITLLLLTLITLLPWPDINFITDAITLGMGYIRTYETVLPLDFIMFLFLTEMIFEGVMIVLKLSSKIGSFIGGHKTPTE